MAASVQTVIAQTTNSSASGTANLNTGSFCNRFSVMIQSGAPSRGLVPRFTVSWDGATFVPTSPQGVFGAVYIFDVPATNVGVSFSNNPSGNPVTVFAYALSD